jgi:Flp pilus assembly protein CpaB
VLVGAALAWDLKGSPTVTHPFAARSLEAGAPIGSDDVAWRQIPAGLLVAPVLEGAVPAVDVGEGDPITPSLLTRPSAVPDGWVALPVDVGGHVAPGARIVLIVVDPPGSVPGLVVQAQSGDRFSLDFSPAVVAVPADRAVEVAIAGARGQVVAAVAP